MLCILYFHSVKWFWQNDNSDVYTVSFSLLFIHMIARSSIFGVSQFHVTLRTALRRQRGRGTHFNGATETAPQDSTTTAATRKTSRQWRSSSRGGVSDSPFLVKLALASASLLCTAFQGFVSMVVFWGQLDRLFGHLPFVFVGMMLGVNTVSRCLDAPVPSLECQGAHTTRDGAMLKCMSSVPSDLVATPLIDSWWWGAQPTTIPGGPFANSWSTFLIERADVSFGGHCLRMWALMCEAACEPSTVLSRGGCPQFCSLWFGASINGTLTEPPPGWLLASFDARALG